MFDNPLDTPEFWGRLERIESHLGDKFDRGYYLNENGPYMQQYREMEEILNDRDKWLDPDNAEAVFEFLQDWDIIDDDLDFEDWYGGYLETT